MRCNMPLALFLLMAIPVVAIPAASVAAAPPQGQDDWPIWRGPNYDGVSNQTGLIDDWDPNGGEGSNVAWKRDDLGGRSTPVVMNGRLYLLCRADPATPKEGERVVCLDAKTGETLWENRFNVWLSDVPDTRVGWSSVVGDPETGNVYALGVCGYFQCINGETGSTIWSVPMHERFGLLSTYGGRTNFPVVCDNLVIISAVVIGWGEMAKPAHRFVAFDKLTGEVVWFDGTTPLPYDTTYSSPTVTVIDGQKALVFASGDGKVWAIQPRTGKPIWKYDFSRRGINLSPLVVGQTVFAGHSEENNIGTAMGSMAAINALGKGDVSKTGEKWRQYELMIGKSSPVFLDNRLYCVDDRAKLFVLDAESGETIGRRVPLGTMMRGSLLLADGKIYAVTANGRWYILKPAGDKGVEIVSKGRLPRGETCEASPIAALGAVYLETSGGLYCLRDGNKPTGSQAYPPAPEETPATETDAVAHVQVVPAEVLMRPGETQTFTVNLYNERGQFLRKTSAAFELNGPGQITDDGQFQAPADNQHVATIVRANVGELSGRARVRIVPPLPWAFDFDQLDDAPVTWVGARYRHVIREVDGSKAMVKITTIPKGTRSRCWFGHSDLANYTIQADVKGARTDDKMPDIGLIAQGYALDLQGNSQKLQIRSWVPQLRMASTIDFNWEPDTWYTLKLQASVEDGRAVLRGKVWPRGESEPGDWTLTATDDSPNLSGSPGLYGNAKDAELYIDNLTVKANQ